MGTMHEPPEPYIVPMQMEQLIARYEEMALLMAKVINRQAIKVIMKILLLYLR